MIFYGPHGDVLGAIGPFATFSVIELCLQRLFRIGRALKADTWEAKDYGPNKKP